MLTAVYVYTLLLFCKICLHSVMTISFGNATLDRFAKTSDMENTLAIVDALQRNRRQSPAFKAALCSAEETAEAAQKVIERLQQSVQAYDNSSILEWLQPYDGDAFEELQSLQRVLLMRIQVAGSLQ